LLDTEEEDMTARLDKARKLLRHLSINRIVMNNLEWNTLFEAYLKSLLIHNFIPLLALDSRARGWAGKNIIHSMIYALGVTAIYAP